MDNQFLIAKLQIQLRAKTVRFAQPALLVCNQLLSSNNNESVLSSSQQVKVVFRQIKEHVEYGKKNLYKSSFRENFPSINRMLRRIVFEQPEFEYRIQQVERFRSQKTDAGILKLAKFIKRTGLPFYRFVSGSNHKYWKHKVPLRNIHYYYTQIVIPELVQQLFCDYVRDTIAIWHKLSYVLSAYTSNLDNEKGTVDLHAEIKGIKKECDDRVDVLVKTLTQNVSSCFDELASTLQKVGTMELNSTYFSSFINDNRKVKSRNNLEKQAAQINRGYEVQVDRALLIVELYLHSIELKTSFNLVLKRFNEKCTTGIYPIFDDIQKQVESMFINIYEESDLNKALKHALNKKTKLYTEETVTQAVKNIYQQNVAEIALGLDRLYELSSSKLSYEHKISAKDDLTKGLRNFEVAKLNTNEFLKKESDLIILPLIESMNSSLAQLSNTTAAGLQELPKLLSYHVNSALINTNNEIKREEIIEELKEGCSRILIKISELKDAYQHVFDSIENSIENALQDLDETLFNIQRINSLIQVKLLKGKKGAEAGWRLVAERIKYYWVFTIKLSRIKIRKTLGLFISAYRKAETELGVSKASLNVKEGVVQYLSESTKAFEALPLVYKLLFELDSTSDENFFVSREMELNQLQYSYEKWLNGTESSALLIGKKGSGTSTLFNFLVKNIDKNIQVSIIQPLETSIEESYWINSISTALKIKAKSKEDLISKLNNSEQRRVILLDDLHKLFLKTVNGFNGISWFFSLIHSTAQKVFWVSTTTDIAAKYLENIMQLSERFYSVVRLNPFTDADLEHLILKRHSISGFKLVFYDTQQKEYVDAKSYELRQTELRKAYFKWLNKDSDGSLMLALLKWVRSITVLDEETMQVRITEHNLEFLKQLSELKIQILSALILHDGLNEKQVAEVLSITELEAIENLKNLTRIAVIEERDGDYHLNMLLYWYIVKLLKLKNIIH